MQIDQPPKNADSMFGREIDLFKRGAGGIMEKAKVWFTIVLVMLGFGCISPVFAVDADFTMTVPNGWTQRTKSTALAQYQKGPRSFIVTADTMPKNANTPDAYIAFVKEQLGKAFKTITFEPVVVGKIDGHDTRELKYTVDTSGIKMKYDVLYVFNKGKAYTLMAATMDDFYDAAFAADIKVFFTSFKFK